MRTKRWWLLTMWLLGLSTLAAAEPDPNLKPPRLVVHEWGTFTTMQGSDGVTLEGLHHDEEQLPRFVYSRDLLSPAEVAMREYAFNKMETPVTYFYPSQPMLVRVRVRFPAGILTQWYPNVRHFVPDLAEAGGPKLELKNGVLNWGEVNLISPSAEAEALLPSVGADDPWAYARQTDAALVQVNDWQPSRGYSKQTEKYLFYRGLGRCEMPLRAKTRNGGTLELRNTSSHALRHVFVLRVEDGRGTFQYVPELAGGAQLELSISMPADAPDLPIHAARLREKLEEALTACGLYPKEARAMALTWNRSYFHTPGLRVLYVLPDEQTRAILPLEVEPAPQETVRVMVARLECLTPEQEDRVAGAVAQLDAPDFERRDAASRTLRELGRFAEPNLRRVLSKAEAPELRARVQRLLQRFEPLK